MSDEVISFLVRYTCKKDLTILGKQRAGCQRKSCLRCKDVKKELVRQG